MCVVSDRMYDTCLEFIVYISTFGAEMFIFTGSRHVFMWEILVSGHAFT